MGGFHRSSHSHCKFVTREVDGAVWRSLEDQFNRNPFLSSQWLGAFKTSSVRPIYLTISSKDHVCALMSGLIIQSSHLFIKELVKQLYCFSGPVIIDSGMITIDDCICSIGDYAKREHIHKVNFDSYYYPFDVTVDNPNFEKKYRDEYVIEIAPDMEKLKKNIKKNQRKRINKLETAGLRFRETFEPEALEQLIAGMANVKQRKAQCGNDISYSPFYITYLDAKVSMRLLNKRVGHIYQLIDEDNVLCSCFIVEYKRCAYSIFFGSSPAGYEMGASAYLKWEIIKRYIGRQIRSLNLGGVPHDDSAEGLIAYKEAMGARRFTCAGGKMENIQGPLLTLIYKHYNKFISRRS